MNLTVARQRHHGNATPRVHVPAAASSVSTSTNLSRFGATRRRGGGKQPYHRNRNPPVPLLRDVSPPADVWTGTGVANSSSTSSSGVGLAPIAVHFLVVGALFVTVVVLALINAYLHYRSQRWRLARRRTYVATPEERFASQRRSRRSANDEAAAGGQLRSTGMSVRMKPTKMFK